MDSKKNLVVAVVSVLFLLAAAGMVCASGQPEEKKESTGGAAMEAADAYGGYAPIKDKRYTISWMISSPIPLDEDAEMIGYWRDACPVETDNDLVKATAYVHRGERVAIAVASWAGEAVDVRIDLDWEAVGLDPAGVTVSVPEIGFFQEELPGVSLGSVGTGGRSGSVSGTGITAVSAASLVEATGGCESAASSIWLISDRMYSAKAGSSPTNAHTLSRRFQSAIFPPFIRTRTTTGTWTWNIFPKSAPEESS